MKQDYVEVGGIVRDGKLEIPHRSAMAAAIKRFADGEVTIHIEATKPTRSNQQNRFWHGVVIPLFAEYCGYDVGEMKDQLALSLIPREITDLQTGEIRIVPGHTSQLSTEEFNHLIE